jgi:DNA-binding helix-hairpin-helix protein with protein kinase domain
MPTYLRADQSPLRLGEHLATGGEAELYLLRNEPHLVAKIYPQPTARHAAKLRAMLANPPTRLIASEDDTFAIWPTKIKTSTRLNDG